MEITAFERAVLERIRAEVQRRFTGIDDLAHGWEHIERVYNLALSLAQQEEANRFIVGMAALLHDLGRSIPHSEAGEHHADVSVTLATHLLGKYGVPEEQQQAILHAIIAHSFSKGIAPQTLEACIVRDADRLDALGAIGILRWAITGTIRRTDETRSYHPTDPFGEHHALDDKRYMLDHFYRKLFQLRETMLTQTGRAWAEQRTAFMHSYLDELQHELAQ